jgi:hypothetical protein
MAPQGNSSGMIVMIIALVLVSLVLGGSYWFFVLNKPKADVAISAMANSATFTVTGYTKPVYIVLKIGTSISHGSYALDGKYTFMALPSTTTYKYYVLTEDMDALLANGTFTTTAPPAGGGAPAGSPPSIVPVTGGPQPVTGGPQPVSGPTGPA